MAGFFEASFKAAEEFFAVKIVQKNFAALDAAGYYVVDCSGDIDSFASRHG